MNDPCKRAALRAAFGFVFGLTAGVVAAGLLARAAYDRHWLPVERGTYFAFAWAACVAFGTLAAPAFGYVVDGRRKR